MAYFDQELRFGVTSQFRSQLQIAAGRYGVTETEYARDAVADALRSEGLPPGMIGRTPADRRIEAIVALPEAVGRGSVARHLALSTAITVEQARMILNKCERDPAELASNIIEQHRGLRGGQASK